MKQDTPKIDPLTGVVKSSELLQHIRDCVKGDWNSRSYVMGALKYLTCFPPNPYIVPLLRRALEKAA